MRWEELTSPRLDAADRGTPVVLNVAAIEQHGPHLPLATDALIGRHFLDRLDAALGPRVLTLPQVKVCCSRHHLDFAGTLSVRHGTFLAYVSETLQGVVDAGFRTLVVLNSHGGNQAIGQVLLEEFGADNPGTSVSFVTWWRLARDALLAISTSGPYGVGHACELETSLIQLIAPALVVPPIPAGRHYVHAQPWADGDMLRAAPGALYRSMRDVSGGSGVVGTPDQASPEKGRAVSDAVTAELVALVRSLSPAAPSRAVAE